MEKKILNCHIDLKNGGELVVDLDQKIFHSVSHTVGSNWAKNIYYNYKYIMLIKNWYNFR